MRQGDDADAGGRPTHIGVAEVAVVTGATLAMLNATAFTTSDLPHDRLADLLRRAALAALLARRVPAQ